MLVPVLRERGLTAYRADLDPTPGTITPQMLSKLLEARLVIADLTGRNPNVFYELGIAHAFERPLISLAASAKDLPFDASDERVIELGAQVGESLTMVQGQNATAQLRSALDVVLDDQYKPRSPLTAVATGRRIDDLSPTDPIAADLALIRDGVDELRSRPVPVSIDLDGAMVDEVSTFPGWPAEVQPLIDEWVAGNIANYAWLNELAATQSVEEFNALFLQDPGIREQTENYADKIRHELGLPARSRN